MVVVFSNLSDSCICFLSEVLEPYVKPQFIIFSSDKSTGVHACSQKVPPH